MCVGLRTCIGSVKSENLWMMNWASSLMHVCGNTVSFQSYLDLQGKSGLTFGLERQSEAIIQNRSHWALNAQHALDVSELVYAVTVCIAEQLLSHYDNLLTVFNTYCIYFTVTFYRIFLVCIENAKLFLYSLKCNLFFFLIIYILCCNMTQKVKQIKSNLFSCTEFCHL